MSIKAIILAGGRATRLMPLTAQTPKSLVPVLNTPFMDHLLALLQKHGVNEVTIAGGHLFASLQKHYDQKRDLGVNLSFVYEEQPLGTAGAVANAWDGQQETVLVLNGDIFSDVNIQHMLAFHQQNKASLTFLLTSVDDPSQYGVVETDNSGRVLSFTEKPPKEKANSHFINAGIYVMEASVLQRVPLGQAVSFEKDIFPSLLAEGELVYGYQSAAYWIDIGRATDYLKLNFDLLNGRAQTFVVPPDGLYDVSKQVIAHRGAVIAKDAQIKKSIIWRGCTVGRQTIVDNCVLCDRVFVSADCYIKDSLLGANVYIKEGQQVIEQKLAADAVFG